jgi:hypothetical protein
MSEGEVLMELANCLQTPFLFLFVNAKYLQTVIVGEKNGKL